MNCRNCGAPVPVKTFMDCEYCGTQYGQRVKFTPPGRKTLGGFVTHDTRHTAVSYLLDLGYDLKTIGELTGHTDETLVLLYSHVKRSTVLAAYDALDKEFAGTGTLGMK